MEQADPHLATVEGVRERIQDIRTNFEAAHKTTGNIVNYLMLQLEQQVQHCLSLQSTVQSLQQEKAQMDSYIQILSGQLQDHQKRAQEDQEWKEKGVQALAFLKQKALSSTQGWNTCSLELKWAKRNLSEKEMELDACRTKLDETEQKLARISLEFEAARAKAIGEDGVGGHVKGLSDEQRKQIEEALKSELDTRSQVSEYRIISHSGVFRLLIVFEVLQKAQLAISAAVKVDNPFPRDTSIDSLFFQRTEQTHRARIQELELELERYKAASNVSLFFIYTSSYTS